jgi:ComF family protein
VCGERLLSPHVLASSDGRILCQFCSRVEQQFAKAIAYGSYEGVLRELVHLLKYGGIRPVADVLGRALAEAISVRELFPGDVSESSPVLVVPVPLHRSRRRRRGFNHAELIARSAMKFLAADPRMIPMVIGEDVLERKRETQSQIGLTIHQRQENMRGAFAVRRAQEVNGREVLLVDDVYTTGATVSECARVLRRAGASKVCVATVARTLKIASKYGDIKLTAGVASVAVDKTLGKAVAS